MRPDGCSARTELYISNCTPKEILRDFRICTSAMHSTVEMPELLLSAPVHMKYQDLCVIEAVA
jgi:hypothetical protein